MFEMRNLAITIIISVVISKRHNERERGKKMYGARKRHAKKNVIEDVTNYY